MRFSERKGYKKISSIIQTEEVSEELRNSVWSIIYVLWWKQEYFIVDEETVNHYDQELGKLTIGNFSQSLWLHYFKKPIDSRPWNAEATFKIIRDYFFNCSWFEFYDFLEYTLNYYDEEELK